MAQKLVTEHKINYEMQSTLNKTRRVNEVWIKDRRITEGTV
jgi:hypothetical protein